MADLSNVVRMLIHQLDATRSYLLPGYCDEDEKARAVIAFAESALAAEPPAPAPAADGERDHVPGAGNMVAADGEREELAQWLERIGDDYDDLYRLPSALIRPKLARAAALLRQLPPEGMEAIRYCVEEDGAVIQRTSRAPESWAIRAGSACMSTTGEWDIEPMPSDRTDKWLANHRWPSAAAAWAALRQSRGQEVEQ